MNREIMGRGGAVLSRLCQKHEAPMIRTVTGNILCAVCEHTRAVVAESLVATHKIEKASLVAFIREGGDSKTCECPDHRRTLVDFEHD